MEKYKIEGNISFYDELFKSLDDVSDDETENVCQITGLPLEDKFIVLECNHKFNYVALYKELCRQKFDFKTYDIHLLSKKEQQQIKNSNLDYFIKCPYCRNIQFEILPDHENFKLEKKYGINSLDNTLPTKPQISYKYYNSGPFYGDDNYTFKMYGEIFTKGQCCEQILYIQGKPIYKPCLGKYCALIPNTELRYCKNHYKKVLRDHKISEKNKLLEEKKKQMEEKKMQIEEKKKQIEEKKKQKEELILEKQQLLEEINKERNIKGLEILKRLPKKKKIENIVQPGAEITIFIPDVEETNEFIGCKAILKSGIHKGKPCGSKLINNNCFCKRHNTNKINLEL